MSDTYDPTFSVLSDIRDTLCRIENILLRQFAPPVEDTITVGDIDVPRTVNHNILYFLGGYPYAKIDAIKYARNALGLTLEDAKELIDIYVIRQDASGKEPVNEI
jgi:hypothetical protein